MEDMVALSWHGALDRVFSKCGEDPFPYTTVKLYHCKRIFRKRLGAEARSFWRINWNGRWSVMSDFLRSHWSNLLTASTIARHSIPICAKYCWVEVKLLEL